LPSLEDKPGFNDDWGMVSAWVSSLGTPLRTKKRARRSKDLLGQRRQARNVRNEKTDGHAAQIEKWAQSFELNLSPTHEAGISFTFESWSARNISKIVNRTTRRKSAPSCTKFDAIARPMARLAVSPGAINRP